MPEQVDDVYPSDGTYISGSKKEPPEQDVERKKEKARTLESLPLLKEIIQRLEERIEFYGSVDAMPKELKTSPTKFMNMHNTNELVRENLKMEKEYLQDLIDTHAKGL